MSYLLTPTEDRKAFCDEFKTGDHYTHTFISRKSLRLLCENITVAEFETAIQIAVESLKGAKQSMNTIQFNDVLSTEILKEEQKHQKEVEKLLRKENLERETMRTALASSITEKEVEIRELKTSLSASDIMIQKLREQVQSSESMFRSSLYDVVKQ